MADFDRTSMRTGATTRPMDASIDQGLRAYMLGVYNLMTLGLAITGLVAWALAKASFVFSSEGSLVGVTSFGATLVGSPLMWVVMLAPLGLVFFLSFRINSLQANTARVLFFVYSALVGASLMTVFAVYATGDIVRVFFITAATFGALSLWGYTTSRSLSGWGSFLFMGLIGIIIASIVNIFMASSALNFAISVIGVLVFAGLTAYDTQKIKEMYYEGDDAQVAGRKSVMGALALYLDFINLFLMLLRLLGSSRN